MFLTQNELIELTGYEMPGWQRRWLNAHHWVYETAANTLPETRKSGRKPPQEPHV